MSPVRGINGITFSFLQAINSFVFLPLSEIREVQIMKKWIVLFLLLEGVVGYAVEYKTRLVVGITIDQFYPEWLTMYRNDLREGGLRRLMQQGKKVMADYDYLYTQTGVDQASIYTGVLPVEHGIISHDWYDRLRKRRENNVKTRDFSEIGGSFAVGYAPVQLQAMTLGCAMKKENIFSKVYSIAMNPEDAVLSGGTCADMAFWFNENSGTWVSSDFYADSLPAWLKNYNAVVESDFFIRRGWMPLAEEENSTTSLKFKNKLGGRNSFFYDIMQAKRKFDTYRVLKATPYANTLVEQLAEKLIAETSLGRDNDADLLALTFSALDYMNRDFGVYAREFRDMVLRLDRDLEKLFDLLDTKVGKENYTVFLTFSEARELLPEELSEMRIQGGYFSIFKSVALLKSYMSLVYGEGDWIADYDAGQIYLDRELVERNHISLKEMQDKVADFMIEFEGVSKVLTAYSLTRNAFSHGSEMLMQNAYSQKRSGDVLFCLQPAWVPDLKDREDNYFRYSKRNKVPLYFYGAGINAPLSGECRIADILPTLCQIMGITPPYTAKGKALFQ